MNSAKFSWEKSFNYNMEVTPDWILDAWPAITVKPPWRPVGWIRNPINNYRGEIGVMFEKPNGDQLWCHLRPDVVRGMGCPAAPELEPKMARKKQNAKENP
jgi:hypothetical protein